MKTNYLKFSVCLLAFAVLCNACSHDDSGYSAESKRLALVGNWEGFVNLPDIGDASGTLTINEDGSCSLVSNGAPGFCDLDVATWEVLNDQFRGKGINECDFLVNFSASYSSGKLEGNWSASSAENGALSFMKQ